VRYETAPGQQLQIDFGSTGVAIGEQVQRIHLFVATLGYSRRCYVGVFLHERQSAFLQGLEDRLYRVSVSRSDELSSRPLAAQGAPQPWYGKATKAVKVVCRDFL
jgi:hypothetical protein